MPLLRIVVLGEDVDLRERRADDVVDDTAERPDLVDVVEASDRHHVVAVLEPSRHPALLHREAGRVRDDRLLERDLRAVGERRHHGRVLAPRLGEVLLRGGVAVGILQALDVADHPRLEPEPLDPPIEVQLHTRLVAVARREDDAVPVGVDVEDRADRGLELGVHEHDVLAVRERLERDLGSELDRAGHLADDVDVLAAAEQEGIVRHDRAAGRRSVVERVLRVDGNRLQTRVAERVGGAFGSPVRDADHTHAGHAVHDLVRESLTHEAGADDADADRASFSFARPQGRVDDDHDEISMRLRTSGSTTSRPGHWESFSDMTETGSGQVSPRRGSSAGSPPSVSGV